MLRDTGKWRGRVHMCDGVHGSAVKYRNGAKGWNDTGCTLGKRRNENVDVFVVNAK